MARVTYRGFNLPDGAEVPNVPADLQTLVDGVYLNFPRFVGQAVLPANVDAPQNAAWTELSGLRVPVTLAERHRLKLSCLLKASVVTATVNTPNAGINAGVGAANPNIMRLVANTTGAATLAVGASVWMFGAVFVLQNAGTVTYTVTANGGGSTGTMRFGGDGTTVNSCILSVEDYGQA